MSAKDLLARVPAIMADAFGQGTVQWRATVGSGSYATLTDAHQGAVREVLEYDADRGREVTRFECSLTVPYTSDVLAVRYQVKTDDALEWAVHAIAPDSQHGVMRYALRRDVTLRHTPDRKDAR